MTSTPFRAPRLSRRTLLAQVACAGALVMAGGLAAPRPVEAAPAAVAQKIADHFARVKTMQGDFVQFGPRGEQTGGKFYIQRPGRIRFDYEAPSKVRVISDGRSVVINNAKLKTWDIYPLSKTPLKLLLSERIDLSGANVRKVKEEPDLTTIVLGDKSVFGDSVITLMFDPKTYDLKQWTITDNQGKDTTVIISALQAGAPIPARTFAIDYNRIEREKAEKLQR